MYVNFLSTVGPTSIRLEFCGFITFVKQQELFFLDVFLSVSNSPNRKIMNGFFMNFFNKKAQLSLTNPRDAYEKFARFT